MLAFLSCRFCCWSLTGKYGVDTDLKQDCVSPWQLVFTPWQLKLRICVFVLTERVFTWFKSKATGCKGLISQRLLMLNHVFHDVLAKVFA